MPSIAKLSAVLALCLPFAAQSHDVWLVPSSTVLSGTDSWITVDAAVGNDKFYFNHAPLRLDNLSIAAPDGSIVAAENIHRGKLRSTFDLQLKQNGTYRVAVINDGVFARWKEDGKPKRYSGKAEGLAQAIPAKAEELEINQTLSRIETFATAGKLSDIKLSGKGLELAAVTHPNDLFHGETATFRMMLDGKPAAELAMTIVPGGSRYRDKVNEIELKTDKDGKFSVKWPQPGLYWIEAAAEDDKITVPQAKKRRLSYVTTVEVLQP